MGSWWCLPSRLPDANHRPRCARGKRETDELSSYRSLHLIYAGEASGYFVSTGKEKKRRRRRRPRLKIFLSQRSNIYMYIAFVSPHLCRHSSSLHYIISAYAQSLTHCWFLGTASEVRLLYHAISRTRNSKRAGFAYTRTYVVAFWESRSLCDV